MKFLAILVLFFSVFVTTFAELPPHAYEDMKKKAPELLTIRVVDVSIDSTMEKDRSGNEVVVKNITAKSTIQSVKKTSTKKRRGNSITINYTVRIHDPNSGWVGQSQIPILEKNTTYTSFLRYVKDEKRYAPSAGSHSFEEVIQTKKSKKKK